MLDFNKIEKKWQKIWQEERIYEPDLKRAKKPFYNLMMFPYPSAEGLHVGNMYAFTGSDIYGRFKRMNQYDVFEPIGLDGFGIHSENYALRIGKHPMRQAKVSEKRFYKQLKAIGNGFAWRNRLETYNSEYYHWTQWIFIQLFKKGLAYRRKQAVNWCPSCKTVLSDEQVIDGKCERCSSKIKKKELEQWFFKITDYAEKLLQNLDKLDWSEKVKIAQKNWIGKSEGALVNFSIQNSDSVIRVFTTRPDTLFGATYIVLAPENEFIASYQSRIKNYKETEDYIKKTAKKSEAERIAEGREKSGVELNGIKAINPATKEKIPIWIADYVLASYGTGAIMAVPAHDERDFAFAKKYDLPIKIVICPNFPKPVCPVLEKAFIEEGYLINSGRFTGIKSVVAKEEIIKWLEKNKFGKKKVNYRLRDWIISRQRYWGPPIPMVYCEKCGWQPVPEKDLPVKLPFIKNFRPLGKGESPLASVKSFYKTKCPNCGFSARRETDVSDTFLDSAWYYLGYLMLKNKRFSFDKYLFEKWLPVDMYIGGAEHAVLHLLYVRFIAMFLHDLGVVYFEEPFEKFRAHGLLIKEGAKMSKSKGNVVVPDEYIKKFGADTLRMYLMFLSPFEQGGDFRDAGILGTKRFLERIWRFYTAMQKMRIHANGANKNKSVDSNLFVDLDRLLHQTIKKVTEDIENLRFNTAISALMILFNKMEKSSQQYNNKTIEQFLKLLAPFAPHLTEELYQQFFGNSKSKILNSKNQKFKGFKSIHLEKWPRYDKKLIQEESFELVIQINGKVRDTIFVNRGVSQEEAEKMALSLDKIKILIAGKEIKKVIFVPDRLINFVLK